MLKLKTIGKDRRCKLKIGDEDVVKKLYLGSITMQDIGIIMGVSHQRVSQIIDKMGTMKDVRKADARKHLRRYRTDGKYRAKMSEAKRGYRIYKLKVIKNYERQQKKRSAK